MEKVEIVHKCACCGKYGEDLSLLSANHKELGWIKICKECWATFYTKNEMVAGTGSSGSAMGSNSPCSSCPGCRF